jgi:hypothetical protein
MDREVSREMYGRGIWILKERIKDLAEVQKKDKQILRMPRKTKGDLCQLQYALSALDRDSKYYKYDTSQLQSAVQMRRFKISAYLNVYAEVRGKAPCHSPRDGLTYYLPRYTKEAREEFEKACGITSELSSAQSPTGRST